MSAFTEVPILDLSLSWDPSTKPAFLSDLKRALLEVGFLYIKNTGIDPALTEDVIRLGKQFFEIPEEEKLRIEMKNCTSFVVSRPHPKLRADTPPFPLQLHISSATPVSETSSPPTPPTGANKSTSGPSSPPPTHPSLDTVSFAAQTCGRPKTSSPASAKLSKPTLKRWGSSLASLRALSPRLSDFRGTRLRNIITESGRARAVQRDRIS